MSMSFNEFQRELQRRNIDGPVAVMLTTMYEQIRETAEQVHQCATIIETLVNTVANFTALHEATQGQVSELRKRMMPGSVESTPITDEDDYG